ncbi:MAG: hypothetical protein ACO1NO_00575 [Burkholderiaceae bacterium]
MNKPAKKILLAIRPSDLPAVAALLGDGFDVIVSHRLEQATAALSAEIGLIACGVHFDGGMLFELLNATRSNPATRDTPFFVLLKEKKGYSQPIIDGIRSASKLLGATDFIDLLSLTQELGEEGAKQALRKGVREILV